MPVISLLGSTGSIGRQTLEVVRAYPERFSLYALTAGENIDLLAEQAIFFRPKVIVVANEKKYLPLKNLVQGLGIEVRAGTAALSEVVRAESVDIVVSALVGFAGLEPTLVAIQAGKTIALANKETLVVAGELMTEQAQQHNVRILPVDSEHSAIFQCLVGENNHEIERLILTASGGPFRGRKKVELANVQVADALKHPNWSMGHKITIDSATLVNKGLEVIEAHWLFGLSEEKISVVVHPQSIIHSLVEFVDGSLKAQMGLPDMRLPIQYALTFPERIFCAGTRFDFANYPNLSFEAVAHDTFRGIVLARKALQIGGNAPCVLNAANEVAVAHFLQAKIGFLQIYDYIETALQQIPHFAVPTLVDLVETDAATRALFAN